MALAESVTRNSKLAHLKENERRALAELVNRLRGRYGDDLLRVALFGSKARGDFDEESDLDVLVVVKHIPDETYWRHRSEIVESTYDLELKHDVVFSLLVLDEEEYGRMRLWNLLINRNIARDGIDLWTSRSSEPQFA